MAQIDLKYYLLKDKVCTLALPLRKIPRFIFATISRENKTTIWEPSQNHMHVQVKKTTGLHGCMYLIGHIYIY